MKNFDLTPPESEALRFLHQQQRDIQERIKAVADSIRARLGMPPSSDIEVSPDGRRVSFKEPALEAKKNLNGKAVASKGAD